MNENFYREISKPKTKNKSGIRQRGHTQRLLVKFELKSKWENCEWDKPLKWSHWKMLKSSQSQNAKVIQRQNGIEYKNCNQCVLKTEGERSEKGRICNKNKNNDRQYGSLEAKGYFFAIQFNVFMFRFSQYPYDLSNTRFLVRISF